MKQNILTEGPLLDEDGSLFEAGWATKPVKTYRRADIKASSLRIKEWDYYLINDDHYAVALTIADNSYLGMVSASLIRLDEGTEVTESVICPLTKGSFHMPESSENGSVEYRDERVQMRFENKRGKRHLICHFLNFDGDKALDVDLKLVRAKHDRMVIATPFRRDKTAFYYNQKLSCIPCEGLVEIGSEKIPFSRETALGCLDWGRGVWTYDNTWYWSNASAWIDGHLFGWNFGYGFGDTSKATENVLFYDGKAHKLGRVKFHIPRSNHRGYSYTDAWRITSGDFRVNLVFEPILDRCSDINAGVIRSDQHQVFGKFSGRCILNDGTVIRVKDVTGFAERVKNRW